ncbi:serine hydrolase [Dyadobacter sp. CY323]|uniref:serine hydrolase domain-containing protein n=1 Tax=Dyadobacter sp. CY323 TaxID=2907302 RepID=UPI001F16F504|nr:serine hydrolase [Dyadobacter sp. CY323]MCE6989667.1 beta-lactamase family protein [Dyadobacter sp. CY323]
MSRRSKAACIPIILLFLLTYLEATAQDKSVHLKMLFDTLSRRGNFNGCVLVAEQDRILFQSAYGAANKENNRLLTNASTFELASVSKLFTATAIMQLKEKGLVSYDDSLKKFFPELPYKSVTIRHLLTNTSGIEDFLAWTENDIDIKRINNNADIIKRLVAKARPTAFEPGSEVLYSNTNYALLASIVEMVSGQSFAGYLARNIFLPAGMTTTKVYSRHSDESPKAYAFDYSWDGSRNQFIRTDSLKRYTYHLAGVYGAYGVISNTGDLYKWDQALSKNLLVRESTLKEALQPFILNQTTRFGEVTPGIPYTFVWQLLPGDPGYRDMFAPGGYGGYTSLIVRKVSRKQTVILLSNINDACDVMTIMDPIDRILEGEPVSYPETIRQSRGIRLSPEKLSTFQGKYVSPENPAQTMTITFSGGNLYAKSGDAMEQNVFPESANTFFLNNTTLKLVFEPDAAGRVNQLKIVNQGMRFMLIKVR